MRAKEFEFRAMLLLVILAETAAIAFLLHEPKPAAKTQFTADAGTSVSMLINGERFPVETTPGQRVTLIVENDKKPTPPLPMRTIIPYTAEQEKMSRVTEPRFRFRFDEPKDLRRLLVDEKLETLRERDDWGTVVNVLKWGRAQFEPGTPQVYPTQNASRLLPALRSGRQEGFCAQYCYVTVQALQALGFTARYITIDGHEVAEVYVPRMRKWIAIDPMYAAYYEDARGRKLSALEVFRERASAKIVSDLPGLDARKMAENYRLLAYWLRNDLYTTPVNIYDLDLYRVRLLLDPSDALQIKPTALCTIFPEEIYARPEPNASASL